MNLLSFKSFFSIFVVGLITSHSLSAAELDEELRTDLVCTSMTSSLLAFSNLAIVEDGSIDKLLAANQDGSQPSRARTVETLKFLKDNLDQSVLDYIPRYYVACAKGELKAVPVKSARLEELGHAEMCVREAAVGQFFLAQAVQGAPLEAAAKAFVDGLSAPAEAELNRAFAIGENMYSLESLQDASNYILELMVRCKVQYQTTYEGVSEAKLLKQLGVADK